MTGLDAIQWADDLSPNQYTNGQKLAWLSDHDGRVWRETVSRYVGSGDAPEAYTDGTETLLIDAPYARDVYGNYLVAKIAEANREAAPYAQYMTAYNAAIRAWTDTWNREHRIKPGRTWTF